MIAVGVPEIAPVEVSKDKPAGSVGVTDQEVIAPPLAVGVAVVMVTSFVNEKGLPLKATDAGAASLTTMVTVVVALPPVLVAVTVYAAEDVITVGVPEISPVEVSKMRPVGRLGETCQVTTSPPLEVGVDAVMAMSLVRVNGLPLYAIDEGVTSLTTKVTVVETLPPVFVAVIV